VDTMEETFSVLSVVVLYNEDYYAEESTIYIYIKRRKLGGCQAYDRSYDKAAVVA
jgi:hypothetical protein